MKKILTLNKIADCGLRYFKNESYSITDDVSADCDGIILRSYAMHDMELPKSLKAVARAGAGVNNIPIDKCSEKGIVVFNTPGANANAVKELAITALLIASRDVVGGIEWAKGLKDKGDEAPKLVEKGKGAFVGPEIMGKKLGVIGLGAIGVMVANAAYSLGMEVIGYDPFLSVDAAWHLSRHIVRGTDVKAIFAECDYVTLHVPLNADTKYMVNDEILESSKDGIRILNLSRGDLVDLNALEKAIEAGKVAKYVVDFPDAKALSMDNVISIPHLGASTPESEDNCATMAGAELRDFLENGNIANSVNFPNCQMPREGNVRITIAHKNIPNMLSNFSSAIAGMNINISNMLNKSKGNYAYTIMDVDGDVSDAIKDTFMAMEGTLRVRVLKTRL